MTARRTVALLVLALAYYVFVVGDRAVALLRDERLAFRGLGLGLVLVAVVGVVLVAAEVRFGAAAQRLGRELGDVEALAFDDAAAAVEGAPEDWRAWYRLAVAYGDERDPRRGRAAMRRAIALRAGEGVKQPG
ncbi:MAG TPA: hypothetical protein VF519_09845 [Mycobacteriales bacterium]